jgi:regulator of sigma E protease
MGIISSVYHCYGGLPFLFVLSLVVFFHELGHFLVARWCGVRVLVFSLGFGPELFGFNDRTGTRWKISAIPLGGYVKFLGDENAASVPDTAAAAAMSPEDRKHSFFHKPVAARAAVVVAGPLANFLLAIVISSGILMIYGQRTMTPRVDGVMADGAAAKAGFKPGDLVLSIDGQKIESFADMQRIVTASADRQLEIVVERDGKEVRLEATPALKENKDVFGNVRREGVLGITRSATSPDDVKTEHVGPIQAVALSVEQTATVIGTTLSYIGGIFVGRESPDQLGGPIQIAVISCQVATLGFMPLLNLAAFLSISIGLLNLFPIPLLDGGHLLFYAIETIRGRPLSERAQEVGFRIGLAIVLVLMVFATKNDIVKYVINLFLT